MGKQLPLFAPPPRPLPSEDDRLNARMAAGDQVKRARRENKRTTDAKCPACGERVVVVHG